MGDGSKRKGSRRPVYEVVPEGGIGEKHDNRPVAVGIYPDLGELDGVERSGVDGGDVGGHEIGATCSQDEAITGGVEAAFGYQDQIIW